MASLNVFLSAKSLKQIPSKYLKQILNPLKNELDTLNLWIDENNEKANFNHSLVAKYIRDKAEYISQEILDAFFYIDALIKGKMQDRIFVELSQLNDTSLGDEGELASKLWSINPTLAKRLYSEVRIKSQHSFTFLMPHKPIKEPMAALSNDKIEYIENQLSKWFEENNKGKKVQVFQHDKKDKLFFHIQHGSTLKREAVIDDTDSGVVIFRKEIEDILVFDKNTAEIGIYNSEKTSRLQKFYQSLFSIVFFEEEHFYVPKTKYNLSIILEDNFIINYGNLRNDITLFEIDSFKLEVGSNSGNEITFKSRKDAIALYKSVNLKQYYSVKNIKFKIGFSGDDKAKSFSIYNDKHSSYPQNCDHSLIDKILVLNGICKSSNKKNNDSEFMQLSELKV